MNTAPEYQHDPKSEPIGIIVSLLPHLSEASLWEISQNLQRLVQKRRPPLRLIPGDPISGWLRLFFCDFLFHRK